MEKSIRAFFLFDTSAIRDLDGVRASMLFDNRRFAVIWSVAEFCYGLLCLFLSFFQENYTRCRSVYIAVMVIAAAAFLVAEFLSRKEPLMINVMLREADQRMYDYKSAYYKKLKERKQAEN